MKTLAIIPARGGSKGIENKNMALLGGKPLIEYTLDALIGSELISNTYLATDDTDIANYCFRQKVKNFNSTELSYAVTGDHVQVDEAVLYAIREIEWAYEVRIFDYCDTIIILQPTSPFRAAQHIDEALQLYKDVNINQDPFGEKDTVFSVWEPGWSYNMSGEIYAEAYTHDPTKRLGRQDVDNMGYVTENGAIYIVDAKRFSEERSFRSSRIIPYYMDKKSSIEIDEPIDLAIAEAILAYEDSS